MLGQFIIPAAPGDLSVKAFLRNTARSGEDFDRLPGLSVDLRVFRNGLLQYRDASFAIVPVNGLKEISAATCPDIAGDQSNLLVVAQCSLPEGEGYFAQEHQLIYENKNTGAVSSLLYDQIPVVQPGASTSQIVVIAPKVWIGKSINSFVVFSSTHPEFKPAIQDRPLHITVLNQLGETILTKEISLANNSTFLFDVRDATAGKIELADQPVLLTVVAKGGAGMFAIMTFSISDTSGNFSLEHSLPPIYYASGDMRRIRSESLEFEKTRGT